jgi:hypothetical protein
MAIAVSMCGFSQQECDRYLNKNEKSVKTKAIILNIAHVGAGISDAIFRTNFSSIVPKVEDKIQMLDGVQYNLCMSLQAITNEANREKKEEQIKNTLGEMAKLLASTGALDPKVIEILVENGIVESGKGNNDSDNNSGIRPKYKSAEEVPVPTLPVPVRPGSGSGYSKIVFPCHEYNTSEDGVIRATAIETHEDPQLAKDIARTVALEELASKIEVTVNSITDYYVNTVTSNQNIRETLKEFNKQTHTTVNQAVNGYEIICTEYEYNSEKGIYRCYLTLQVKEKNIIKPVYDNLKTDKTNTFLPNFDKFRNTFNEVMKFYENVDL